MIKINIWEDDVFICSVELNNFVDLPQWIKKNLDTNKYENRKYKFKCSI